MLCYGCALRRLHNWPLIAGMPPLDGRNLRPRSPDFLPSDLPSKELDGISRAERVAVGNSLIDQALGADGARLMPKAWGHEGPASEAAGKFNISLTHRTSRVVGLSIVLMRSATRSDCPTALPASLASR